MFYSKLKFKTDSPHDASSYLYYVLKTILITDYSY